MSFYIVEIPLVSGTAIMNSIQKLGLWPGYLRCIPGIHKDTPHISGAFGPILISGALGPEDIGRYPGHMTWDPCAQPFPRP